MNTAIQYYEEVDGPDIDFQDEEMREAYEQFLKDHPSTYNPTETDTHNDVYDLDDEYREYRIYEDYEKNE